MGYKDWNDGDGIASDLEIRVLGPYRGSCVVELDTIVEILQEAGYHKTWKCGDIYDEYDSEYQELNPEQAVYQASIDCLADADGAIFLFLKPIKDRLPEDEPRHEMNSSVCTELTFWIENDFVEDDQKYEIICMEPGVEEYLGDPVLGMMRAYGIKHLPIPEAAPRRTADIIKQHIYSWTIDADPRN